MATASHSGHGHFSFSLKISCVELSALLQMWSIQQNSDALYLIIYFYISDYVYKSLGFKLSSLY